MLHNLVEGEVGGRGRGISVLHNTNSH